MEFYTCAESHWKALQGDGFERRNGVKDYRSKLFTVSTTVTGVCYRERFDPKGRKRDG